MAMLGNLIPLPKRIRRQTGRFVSGHQWRVFCDSSDPRILRFLQRTIPTGWTRRLSPDASTLSLFQEPPQDIPGNIPLPMREEAYGLQILSKQIRIWAATAQGLFYGLQTLEQLRTQGDSLPCCVIADWPDMEFRGAHLTLGSGHMPPYERLREFIGKLAFFKLNQFHIEYDNRFCWEKYPFISSPSALTKDQCRELARTAREHFIELVPTLDSLGHQEHYLCHPELKHLRELPHSHAELCASNPKSKAFIKDLWREVLEVHQNARYVNITGDEVFRLGHFCPRCRPYARRGRLADLFFNYYGELVKWMLAQGRRPMMWHDMLASHPERLADYPKELLILYWNYWGTEASRWKVGHGLPSDLLQEDVDSLPIKLQKLYRPYWFHRSTAPDFTPWPYLRFFKDQGFEVLGASGGSPMTSNIPFAGFQSRVKNSRAMARGVKAVEGKGLLHTYWSDCASILTAWTDIAAAGDSSWHSRPESMDSYLDRFDAIYLGSEGGFKPAALKYDQTVFPSNPPGFDLSGHLPSPGDEKKLRTAWVSLRKRCRRNRELLEMITPSLDYFAAINAAKRWVGKRHQPELGAGKDTIIDLAAAFNGQTRRIVPGLTGSYLAVEPGRRTSRGIKVFIQDGGKGRLNALLLAGGRNPKGAKHVEAPLKGEAYDQLFFWHTACYAQGGLEIARYEMVFCDGETEVLPVIANVNIGDWSRGEEILPAALVAWQGFNNENDKNRRMLYLTWWKNRAPSRRIKSVNLISTHADGYVVLLAITGRKFIPGNLQARRRKPLETCRPISALMKTFKKNYRRAIKGRCVAEDVSRAIEQASLNDFNLQSS